MKTDQENRPQSTDLYHCMNEFKADFGSIYNQVDPRAYFATLSQFDYVIPQMAHSVLRAVVNKLRGVRGLDRIHALDVGCSYGINAALLGRGMSLQELYEHYAQPSLAGADAVTVGELDKRFFEQHPRSDDLRITGLDVAERAVAYAERTGLVDLGIEADLESAPPPPDVRAQLAHIDAVISTGCVGYVTQITFGHILEAVRAQQRPWIASFVLRMFPYDHIAETLAAHGLVTEKLEGVLFPQRRFASRDEEASVLATLRDMDIATAGLEDRYGFLAELYLSRPREEAADLSIRDIVPLDSIPERAISLSA